MIKNLLLAATLLSLSLVASGCSPDDARQGQAALQIAAASDLYLAFTEIGELFKEQTGVEITFSFGSTGQLADQIENGAPFDVFAAANIKFVDNLREKGLILNDTQTTYAFGRIGIAILPGSPFTVESLDDFLKPEVKKIAIANPEHAPYGMAAKQALERAGIWAQVEEKLVYGRNISDTLTFIETGNAEAGVIALSLYCEGMVNFHLIDESLHAPLEQSVAVINRTKQKHLAMDFIDFIMGPIGRPVMESYGFIVPGGE